LKDAITADRLQDETYESIRFIVPNLIPAEGVTLLCSKPKLGKSWLVLDLCVGCTADRFVLGEIKPTQGEVLYLALEDSRRRLQRRMAKLLPSFTGKWPSRLTLVTAWRRVSEGSLDDIRAWYKSASQPTMVVVDVLVKVRPIGKSGRSAYELDYEALAGLHKLAVELGIAVLVVHHTRKMAAEDIMDTVSGSFGLVGAADTIIVIERRSQGTVLDVRGRDVESAELAIEFNKQTCRWTLLGSAAGVHKSDERAHILAALAESSEPLLERRHSKAIDFFARPENGIINQLGNLSDNAFFASRGTLLVHLDYISFMHIDRSIVFELVAYSHPEATRLGPLEITPFHSRYRPIPSAPRLPRRQRKTICRPISLPG
jgi:hypothetical protein